MITNRQMWLLLLVIAIAAVCLFGAFIYPRIQERRRRRERDERETMRRTLINLTMGDLTPEVEMRARRLAQEYGLDFDDLDSKEDRYIKRLEERVERDRLAMLERVKAERVRQEALEAEAIRSILEEVPEPRHDEKFQ